MTIFINFHTKIEWIGELFYSLIKNIVRFMVRRILNVNE